MQVHFESTSEFSQSIGSGCPLPRNVNNTTARVIATTISAPNAAIPASAVD